MLLDVFIKYKRLLDTKSISAIFEKPGPSMKNYKSRVFHLSERFLTYKKEFKVWVFIRNTIFDYSRSC